jgi:hypothetical protein
MADHQMLPLPLAPTMYLPTIERQSSPVYHQLMPILPLTTWAEYPEPGLMHYLHRNPPASPPPEFPLIHPPEEIPSRHSPEFLMSLKKSIKKFRNSLIIHRNRPAMVTGHYIDPIRPCNIIIQPPETCKNRFFFHIIDIKLYSFKF